MQQTLKKDDRVEILKSSQKSKWKMAKEQEQREIHMTQVQEPGEYIF